MKIFCFLFVFLCLVAIVFFLYKNPKKIVEYKFVMELDSSMVNSNIAERLIHNKGGDFIILQNDTDWKRFIKVSSPTTLHSNEEYLLTIGAPLATLSEDYTKQTPRGDFRLYYMQPPKLAEPPTGKAYVYKFDATDIMTTP